MHLIDTDVAVHLRDGTAEITERIGRLPVRPRLALMTRVELEGGVHARPHLMALRRAGVDQLIRLLEVVPMDGAVVAAYGDIVAACGFLRSRIIDRLIAATAIVHGLTLITINGADFRDIPRLSLEIWPAPEAQ